MHAHVPCSTDCGRCAVCLRSLDCAPHLPLTPPAKLIAPGPPYRSGMTIGTQRRAAEWFATHYPPVAAVQGGR